MVTIYQSQNQKSRPVEEESSKQKGQSMRKIFNHRILYGQMDDGGQSCQNMSEADGQRCKRLEGQRGRAKS